MLLMVGCKQGSTTEQQDPAPSAQPTIADTDLAVPADFEEEAASSITVANYKTELDAIESEIN
jgi:hypothetical protein